MLNQKNEKTISSAESFQKGLLSVIEITHKMLNGKPDKSFERMKIESKILTYIKGNKEAYLSDMIEEFNIEPDELIAILNDMIKEKKIIKKVD